MTVKMRQAVAKTASILNKNKTAFWLISFVYMNALLRCVYYNSA